MSNDQTPVRDEQLTTWTGFGFTVRPATPDDAAALQEFFTHVTQEDLRFRFLTGLNQLGRAMVERLIQVDHQRSENFLAFDGDRLIGTAMLAADEDGSRAEVAVSLDKDYKGRGIGWCLLDHCARFAASRGVKVLESVESRDNQAAISLEREMGFTAEPVQGDPTLVLLRKQLG